MLPSRAPIVIAYRCASSMRTYLGDPALTTAIYGYPYLELILHDIMFGTPHLVPDKDVEARQPVIANIRQSATEAMAKHENLPLTWPDAVRLVLVGSLAIDPLVQRALRGLFRGAQFYLIGGSVGRPLKQIWKKPLCSNCEGYTLPTVEDMFLCEECGAIVNAAGYIVEYPQSRDNDED